MKIEVMRKLPSNRELGDKIGENFYVNNKTVFYKESDVNWVEISLDILEVIDDLEVESDQNAKIITKLALQAYDRTSLYNVLVADGYKRYKECCLLLLRFVTIQGIEKKYMLYVPREEMKEEDKGVKYLDFGVLLEIKKIVKGV